MEYIAHVRESDKKIQTVKKHLLEVKELAESYGGKIGVKHITGIAGLLHDLGKYTNEFRDYILEAVNNPDAPPKRGSVDHSTAGGKLLYELFHTKNTSPYKGILAEIVGNAIISHHSYLQDFLNVELESKYLKRVRDKDLLEFDETKKHFFNHVMSEKEFHMYVDRAASELEAFLEEDLTEKKIMFLTKFIFSTLIDGDRTNTRLFEEKNPSYSEESSESLFDTYYKKLIDKLQTFYKQKNARSPINLLRREMSEQCDRFSELPSGIYTLSIPTGGGKTLASLRYALKHSMLHQKKRIIYVVPYTTIIEQNANEVRNILKDNKNILEHHSNVIEDINEDDEDQDGFINTRQKLKLAKDNWDSPIIFTTMVQFLNVFYAKGSGNIRRLHNLSEAVIIFDEVQKVPISSVSLFNDAVNFLKQHCQSSIILCTATQPALDFVEHKLDINSDAEVIKDLENVIDAFKRVEIIDKATSETFNNERLAKFINMKMNEVENILVILNTKPVVRDLYNHFLNYMDDSFPIYHLSTSMCAAHRNAILDKIRGLLSEGRKVICISTQLIEAGVDISFDCVIRSLAGLDSIAQAAGRCNRHGEKGMQNVYVIDHEEENLSRLNEISKGKEISKRILIDIARNPEVHGGNILSKQAMKKYFKEFYTDLESDLYYFIPKLKKNMTELLYDSSNRNIYKNKYNRPLELYISNSYYTAAENYHVIDNHTTSVLVPFGEGNEIISQLNGNQSIEDLSKLLKKAQQYTVTLFQQEKELLIKNQGLVSYFSGEVLALKEGAYNEEFGLDTSNDSGLRLNLF